jgi:predicted lipoprotein with Yx(FWY)xxD motif
VTCSAARAWQRGRSLIALLALASAVVAACGGSSPPKPDGHANGPPASLRVERSKWGPILVDSRGRTLYLFTVDRRGHSRCYSACARLWPPATVSGHPIAGPGLTAKLTTTRRPGGARQLVYDGHPLYTLTGDTRPGQINGEDYLGTWFVVSPAGHQIGHGKPSGY